MRGGTAANRAAAGDGATELVAKEAAGAAADRQMSRIAGERVEQVEGAG
jgi:hypothetical protein